MQNLALHLEFVMTASKHSQQALLSIVCVGLPESRFAHVSHAHFARIHERQIHGYSHTLGGVLLLVTAKWLTTAKP